MRRIGVDVNTPETAEYGAFCVRSGRRSEITDFLPLRVVGIGFWCWDASPRDVEVRIVRVFPHVESGCCVHDYETVVDYADSARCRESFVRAALGEVDGQLAKSVQRLA
jgi:hypothetical protein